MLAPTDEFDLDVRFDVRPTATTLNPAAAPERNTQMGDSEWFCCTDPCPTLRN